jgi:hypothetical protein
MQTPPSEINVPHSRTERPPKPPAQLVSMFKDRRLLTFLVGLLVITNVITPVLLVSLLYRTQIIIVADEQGNIVIGPGVDFSEANKVHTMCGILATKALLERSPAGFDAPDLVRNLFHPDAYETAALELRSNQKEMEAKQIHQKAEIESVKVQSIKQTVGAQIYYIVVTGQMIRMGTIDGTPVREVDNFRVQYEMWRNPRLTENGRYPLVVKSYKFTKLDPATPTATRRIN